MIKWKYVAGINQTETAVDILQLYCGRILFCMAASLIYSKGFIIEKYHYVKRKNRLLFHLANISSSIYSIKMLLSITTTRSPATDLFSLLHKNPDKVQAYPIMQGEHEQGQAYVFHPEASENRATVALYVDVDPVGLTYRKEEASAFALEKYVNDRAYSANSGLSTAIATVFVSALNGICKDRPELVNEALPLEITVQAVPGSRQMVELLFLPLGYMLEIEEYELDEFFPFLGKSPYITVKMKNRLRLFDALRHLFTLIPVLDNKKHCWIGGEEVDKIFEKGGAWFAFHPARELITRRYLKSKSYADAVLEHLNEDMGEDEVVCLPLDPLWRTRMERIIELLLENDVDSVIDLGCGEGKYLARFMQESRFQRIAGMDVSHKNLERASERLRLDSLYGVARERISVFQGSLTYHDERLKGYDAAIAVGVIEHMELYRLDSFERAVFMCAAPRVLIVATPNKEYSASYDRLEESGLLYPDRLFEWTRAEFEEWALSVGVRHNYCVSISFVGEEKPGVGAASQLALFIKEET